MQEYITIVMERYKCKNEKNNVHIRYMKGKISHGFRFLKCLGPMASPMFNTHIHISQYFSSAVWNWRLKLANSTHVAKSNTTHFEFLEYDCKSEWGEGEKLIYID